MATHIPMVLFTVLFALGVGTLTIIFAYLIMGEFGAENIKKMDKVSLIAVAAGVIGWIGFTQCNTGIGKAFATFRDAGSLFSIEVIVGAIFVIGAIAYIICAYKGMLSFYPRRIFLIVVAACGLLTAFAMGSIDAPAGLSNENWNMRTDGILMLCCAVVLGQGLGGITLTLCKDKDEGVSGRLLHFEASAVAVVLLIVGMFSMWITCSYLVTGGVVDANPMISYLPLAIAALVLAAASVVCMVPATKKLVTTPAIAGFVLAVIAAVMVRLISYGMMDTVAGLF